MKGLTFLWRMACKRKANSMLVFLFTMAATIFLLLYPNFIENTRTRLKEAYRSVEVKGWIINGESYEDPAIPGEQWKALLNSGYFGESSAYNHVTFHLYSQDQLKAHTGKEADDAQKLRTVRTMLQQEESPRSNGRMYTYNSFEACDQLVRIREKITWLDGYDESCLESSERICILSDIFGHRTGEIVPFLIPIKMKDNSQVYCVFPLKVAAIYHGNITDFKAVMPIAAYEELCSAATLEYQKAGSDMTWPFDLKSFIFTVEDNYKIDELKDYLVQQKLAGQESIRVVIDDRILKGTVAPIESNLALLEGLYAFFFVTVTIIGFFINFLMAKGRKPEYAIMRMLGESRMQITLKVLYEQFVLCLGGVLLGAIVVWGIEKNNFSPTICPVILLCYTLGAAAAVLLTVRVNVMDILRDKE